MKNLLKQWWADHGTKILGYGSMIVGMLEVLDAHTVQVIQSVFGPKYGPIVSGVIQVLSGIAVARRGVINSRKLNANPPA